MQKISSIILRLSLAMVIIWFGTQQLLNPSMWIGYLPNFTKSLPINQINFVSLNGYFEIIFGLLLMLGFYTRLVVGILALHLLGITLSVGYDATGVRDFGLSMSLISLFFQDINPYSLDNLFRKNNTI